MPDTAERRRTALYRLYDEAGTLLYIGITENPEARWRGHAHTKPWWGQVARKDLRWFETRQGAETAEVTAIRSEQTPFNVDDSPWARRARELGPDEFTGRSLISNLRDVTRRLTAGEMLWAVNRKWSRDREAALIPIELGELVRSVGGPDVAATILAGHVKPTDQPGSPA